jgi:hypothetical protein
MHVVVSRTRSHSTASATRIIINGRRLMEHFDERRMELDDVVSQRWINPPQLESK